MIAFFGYPSIRVLFSNTYLVAPIKKTKIKKNTQKKIRYLIIFFILVESYSQSYIETAKGEQLP